MITQTEIKQFILQAIVGSPLSLIVFTEQPTLVNSTDYGFDIDEQELGQELLAPLSASIAEESNPSVAAEDFDTLFKWFIS